MSAKEFHELEMFLENRNLLFCYHGFLSQSILTPLTKTLKAKIKAEDKPTQATNKVLYVFVELAQNIIRYSAVSDDIELNEEKCSKGSLAIGYYDGAFFCISGNVVTNRQAQHLLNQFESLRDKNSDELKFMFKQRLKDGPLEDSQGASLGLIEMARRSSKPIFYDFIDISDENKFFTLKITI